MTNDVATSHLANFLVHTHMYAHYKGIRVYIDRRARKCVKKQKFNLGKGKFKKS